MQKLSEKRSLTNLFIALFLTSSSIFIYELLIVRVFSILFKYNVIFIMISVAIMGLGLGGIYYYRYVSTTFKENMPPWVSLGFPFSGSISTWIIIKHFDQIRLEGAILIAIVPFFFGGCVAASIYTARSEQSSRLYFSDMLGGVFGCLASLLLVQWPGVINTIILSGVLAAGAIIFSEPTKRRKIMGYISLVAVTALFGVNMVQKPLKIGPATLRKADTPLGWTMRHMGEDLTWRGSSWGLFSRCDLFSEDKNDDRRTVYINGGTEAVMLRFDSPNETYRKYRNDITYIPYLFGKNDEILILGSGGGRDVLLSLVAGAKKITAVEIDRGVIEMVEANREFTGNIYNQPKVTLRVEDGRTFIMRDKNRYDRIMLSLSSTFGYSDVSSIAQMENYLYTSEAFTEYFDHLKPDGTLTIFINFKELLNKFILASLIHMQDRMGINPMQGMIHTAVVANSSNRYSGYSYALMIKKSPYNISEIETIDYETRKAGLEAIVLPFTRAYGRFQDIASGELTPEKLIEENEMNLSPPSDNQPFFLEVILNYRYRLIYLILAMGFIILLIIALYLLGIIGKVADKSILVSHNYTDLKYFIPFFFLIGVGFMLVEIVLTKRFSFYLAYPQLKLAIVLVAILLGCSLGALSSGKFINNLPQKTLLVTLLLSLMIIVSELLLTKFIRLTVGYSLPIRSLLLIAFLFPTAFLLGMPFPLGLRMLRERLITEIPWFWGLNGIASVTGAVLCVVLAMTWGFQVVFYTATGCYLLVAGLSYLISRNNI